MRKTIPPFNHVRKPVGLVFFPFLKLPDEAVLALTCHPGTPTCFSKYSKGNEDGLVLSIFRVFTEFRRFGRKGTRCGDTKTKFSGEEITGYVNIFAKKKKRSHT